jgi:hypothetical protein
MRTEMASDAAVHAAREDLLQSFLSPEPSVEEPETRRASPAPDSRAKRSAGWLNSTQRAAVNSGAATHQYSYSDGPVPEGEELELRVLNLPTDNPA